MWENTMKTIDLFVSLYSALDKLNNIFLKADKDAALLFHRTTKSVAFTSGDLCLEKWEDIPPLKWCIVSLFKMWFSLNKNF